MPGLEQWSFLIPRPDTLVSGILTKCPVDDKVWIQLKALTVTLGQLRGLPEEEAIKILEKGSYSCTQIRGDTCPLKK